LKTRSEFDVRSLTFGVRRSEFGVPSEEYEGRNLKGEASGTLCIGCCCYFGPMVLAGIGLIVTVMGVDKINAASDPAGRVISD